MRHAESEANDAGVFSGHSDPALTARGRSQAAALGARLSVESIDHVVSSDLTRARQTAELIATPLGLGVDADARFREMNYGDWEGKTSEAISAEYGTEWEALLKPTADFRAPGGESLRELRERVHAGYRDVVDRHAEETVVVVAHGNAIQMLLGALLGVPYENSWRFQLHNTGLTLIRQFDETPVLVQMNDTSHLSGLE